MLHRAITSRSLPVCSSTSDPDLRSLPDMLFSTRMKQLIAVCLLSTGLLSSAILSGCSVDNPMVTEEDLTVKTHFYPIVNGSKYTYVRYNENGYDTVTYQVRVGQKRGDMNYLDRMGTNERVPQVL